MWHDKRSNRNGDSDHRNEEERENNSVLGAERDSANLGTTLDANRTGTASNANIVHPVGTSSAIVGGALPHASSALNASLGAGASPVGLLSPFQQVYGILSQPHQIGALPIQIPVAAQPMIQTSAGGASHVINAQNPQATNTNAFGTATAATAASQVQNIANEANFAGYIPSNSSSFLGHARNPMLLGNAGPPQVLYPGFTPSMPATFNQVPFESIIRSQDNVSFAPAQAQPTSAMEMHNNSVPQPQLFGSSQYLQSQIQGGGQASLPVLANSPLPNSNTAMSMGLLSGSNEHTATGLQQGMVYLPLMLVSQLSNSDAADRPLISMGTEENITPKDDSQDREKKMLKRKRKEKEKVEGLPRRPLTAYNMYFRDEKNRIFAAIDAGMDPEELSENPLSSLQALVKKAKREAKPERIGSNSNTSTSQTDDNGNTSKEDAGTPKEGGTDTGNSSSNTEKAESNGTAEGDSFFDMNQDKYPSCLKSDAFMKSRVPGSKRMRALPHGKIAFVKLARIIGARWKALEKETVSDYDKLAAADMKRYRLEVKEFKRAKSD